MIWDSGTVVSPSVSLLQSAVASCHAPSQALQTVRLVFWRARSPSGAVGARRPFRRFHAVRRREGCSATIDWSRSLQRDTACSSPPGGMHRASTDRTPDNWKRSRVSSFAFHSVWWAATSGRCRDDGVPGQGHGEHCRNTAHGSWESAGASLHVSGRPDKSIPCRAKTRAIRAGWTGLTTIVARARTYTAILAMTQCSPAAGWGEKIHERS